MSYDLGKLTKLAALRVVAGRLLDYVRKEEFSELDGRVEKLEMAKVPTAVSQLENDSGYQTMAQVQATAQAAVAASQHAGFKKAASVPTPDEAEENVLYLVMNAKTGHYDIYAKVDGSVVLLDDTSVDLSGYVTTQGMSDTLKGYVTTGDLAEKLNDFDPDLERVLERYVATDAEVEEMFNEVFASD